MILQTIKKNRYVLFHESFNVFSWINKYLYNFFVIYYITPNQKQSLVKNGIFFCSLEENSSRTNWSKYISIWFINKYKSLQRLHFLETIYDSLPNSISYLLSESLSGTEPSPSVLRLISKYCHKKGVFEEKRVLLRTIPFSYQDYCVFTSKKFLDFMIKISFEKRC